MTDDHITDLDPDPPNAQTDSDAATCPECGAPADGGAETASPPSASLQAAVYGAIPGVGHTWAEGDTAYYHSHTDDDD